MYRKQQLGSELKILETKSLVFLHSAYYQRCFDGLRINLVCNFLNLGNDEVLSELFWDVPSRTKSTGLERGIQNVEKRRAMGCHVYQNKHLGWH